MSSERPQSLSELPQAHIRWHDRTHGTCRGAEVVVNGEVVAWLPVRSFAYTRQDPSHLPLATFTLAAEAADIETYNPARSTR